MKAMETGAPMISVPAGILKEFMSPTNSRTPTPPPVSTVGNSTITSKSSTQTPTATSNSISYTSILPSSIDTSAVSITPATPVHPSLTNGQVLKDEKKIDIKGNEINQKHAENNRVNSVKDGTMGNSGVTESMVNGNTTGVKRESEEDGGSRKPDLKKIRVFAPPVDDGLKRDFSVAVQEFNQHLDNASKKLEEAEKQDNKDLKTLNELRSCFNNVPTGSGIMSGVSSGSSSGKSSESPDGKSSGPSSEMSSGPSSGMSSGPSSGMSSGPSSGMSSGPSSGMSGGPSNGMSSGPSSGMSSGPSNGMSNGPSSGMSSGPSNGMSSGPSSGISSGPSSGISSGPSSGMSSGPSSGISSEPSSGISSGPSSGMSSGPSSGISSGPSSGISSGPSSGMSSGPSSGMSSRPSSGIPSGDGNRSGVSNSSLLAKALVNVVQSKEVEVVPLVPESREVLKPVSREREVLTNNTKDKGISKGDKENKLIKRRLQRLPRKELENMILQQFCEKTLYQSEHGRMKQLCEKLESTLESNRKKTAQFHKEIEDLRKVTNRLSAEHAARKGQYIAPIRIKRSVGIQAAPHIINKGIMHATGSSGTVKTIAPRMSSQVGMIPSTSINQSLITTGTVGILATSQPGVGRPQTVGNVTSAAGLSTMASAQGLGTVRAAAGQMLMMAPTGSMQTLPRASNTGAVSTATAVLPVAQGRVVRAPIGGMNSVVSPAGTLLSSQRPVLLQNDKAVTGTSAGMQTSLTSRGSGVIDLTDEDEGSRGGAGRPSAMVPKPGTLVKVPTSGTAQLLPLQQTGGVGQVVLLPNTSGGQPTTALIVSQVSTAMQTLDSVTNPAVAQSRIGSHGSHTANNSRVMASVVNTATRTTTSTMPQVNQLRHPAPLPRTPFQQVAGLSKKLPPQPTLKLSHKDSSIVLSWTMSKTEDHETIASYQLYAYQEGAASPSPSLWKKVGSVKALELPMACTLTQFMPGHVYHFAVRAVDTKSRLGPFSEPRSIRLDKKLVSLSESL